MLSTEAGVCYVRNLCFHSLTCTRLKCDGLSVLILQHLIQWLFELPNSQLVQRMLIIRKLLTWFLCQVSNVSATYTLH